MYKNDKIQIRIGEELSDYLKDNCENMSRFIREAIRDRIESDKKLKKGFDMVEVRARSPYIYFAELLRVVDGDTLLMMVDLGFFVRIESRLRLSHVDCEPSDTAKGKKAIRFIEKELKGATILITVKKRERFGRYMALVYYSKEYEEFEDIVRHGKLLNEELINRGLAEKH